MVELPEGLHDQVADFDGVWGFAEMEFDEGFGHKFSEALFGIRTKADGPKASSSLRAFDAQLGGAVPRKNL